MYAVCSPVDTSRIFTVYLECLIVSRNLHPLAYNYLFVPALFMGCSKPSVVRSESRVQSPDVCKYRSRENNICSLDVAALISIAV